MTKRLQLQKETMILITVFIIIFAYIFSSAPLIDTWDGYKRILASTSVLLSDFLSIGGLQATLLNVALTIMLNLLLVHMLKLKMTGPIFASLLTITGFAFFGKNLFNALPIYAGIYFYAKATRTEYKNHIIVILLSSGISPIVSFLMFGTSLAFYLSVPLAVAVGMTIGFLLPAFNAHALRFHQGYNLYNTGFSMGVLSMMLTGIIITFGQDIERSATVNNDFHDILFYSTIVLSLVFIIYAFSENPRVYRQYPELLKSGGRLVTDFVRDHGKAVTAFNIGLLGLFVSLVILVLDISINGPVMGAILTVLGFGAFGKHLKNSIPVMLGAWLAIVLTPLEMTIGPILALFFVTGLAPVAGKFGFFAGVLAGFIHLLITPLALNFQGGFDLYNNGFAAGFVAAVLTPVFTTFKWYKEDA